MKRIIIYFFLLVVLGCGERIENNAEITNIEKKQNENFENETHYYYNETSEITGVFDIEAYETESGTSYPFCIRLNKPITVVSKELHDDFNLPLTDVVIVQLSMDQSQIKFAKDNKMYGKKVKIKGEFYHAHSIHHFTELLITVKEIEKF